MACAALAFQRQVRRDDGSPIGEILLATRHAADATPREQQFIAILRRAIAGDVAVAHDMAVGHLAEHPRDALMVRECVLLNGYSGRGDRKPVIAARLADLAPHYGDDPWFLGTRSLALSEIGEIDAATRMAEAGLAIRPDSGVLAHSLAHTFFERGDEHGGRRHLDHWLDEHGDGAANRGHLVWHLALVLLDLGESDAALERYEQEAARGDGPAFPLEDEISLLWRLRMRGVDVARYWEEVAAAQPSPSVRRRFEVAHLAFAHAARSDAAAVSALLGPQSLAPLTEAFTLLLAGDQPGAAAAFDRARESFQALGGSNEQHTLIDDTVRLLSSQSLERSP